MTWLPVLLVGLMFLPLLGWSLVGAWRNHCWAIWTAARTDFIEAYQRAHPGESWPTWMTAVIHDDALCAQYTTRLGLPLRSPNSREKR